MLISNFNLCKTEWLELVFAKRNKEYGAYYIRQHYAENVIKAMVITFLSVTAIIAIVGIAIRTQPVAERMIVVDNNEIYKIPPAPKTAQPKPEAPKSAAAKPAAIINTTKFPPPVVTQDILAVDPPKIDPLKGEAGPVDVKGVGIGINTGDGTGKGTATAGSGTADVPDNKEYKFVDDMPQPIGGEATWSKFLQNNLHYPDEAIDRQIAGKVLVSFIVEKDGHLSNIKVERGPGYGMDEEAARVLKMAKPWKPGMQNGHAVRVKLVLPVNFSLGE